MPAKRSFSVRQAAAIQEARYRRAMDKLQSNERQKSIFDNEKTRAIEASWDFKNESEIGAIRILMTNGNQCLEFLLKLPAGKCKLLVMPGAMVWNMHETFALPIKKAWRYDLLGRVYWTVDGGLRVGAVEVAAIRGMVAEGMEPNIVIVPDAHPDMRSALKAVATLDKMVVICKRVKSKAVSTTKDLVPAKI